MNPHQRYGKMIIASGEDSGAFVYEPSYAHTSATFNARMKKRMAEALKDQSAFKAEEERSNGSVNAPLLLPAPKKSCVELPQAYTHYGD